MTQFSVWELFTFFYCPREFYLYRKLGFSPPPLRKMELAKKQHTQEERRVKRRRTVYGLPEEEILCVLHDVAVEDSELGLYGKVDTVLKLKNGELVPVEVKYTELKSVTRAWRKQMVAYAFLLEKRFNVAVRRGLFYLLPSKRTIWIKIYPEEKSEIKRDVARMRRIVESDSLPRVVDRSKCGYCEMYKYCRRLEV